MTGAAQFEVVDAAAGRRLDARPGRPADADPRRRRDAPVHAGRDERDGEGARPRRPPRRSARRSSSPNTYHLYLRPGHERIARLGGLHRFMAWDRPILTDSGGFQVVSLGDLRVIDEDGATFRSHLDGSLHRFTPELAIAVQEALGSDVAVAFDQPVTPSSPRAVVAEATERTHRWAERSLDAHWPARPGAVRDRPGRARAGPPGREHPVHRVAAVRRHLPRRAGRRRDAGPARGDARRRDPAARGRPAAALPDGPRLAGGPARGGSPGSGPVRFRAAGPRRPERPAVGSGRPPEPPEPALPRRSGPGPGGLSVPAVHAGSRGPTSPICSGRRSCSRTGSRLVTT